MVSVLSAVVINSRNEDIIIAGQEKFNDTSAQIVAAGALKLVSRRRAKWSTFNEKG